MGECILKLTVIPVNTNKGQKDFYVTEEMAKFGSSSYIQVNEQNIMILGMKKPSFTLEDIRYLAGTLRKKASLMKASQVQIDEEKLQEILPYPLEEILFQFLQGWYLGGYEFTKYKKGKDSHEVNLSFQEEYGEIRERALHLAEAVNIARDLCNEPANKLTPEDYANKLISIFKDTKVAVKIVDEKDLEAEGFMATALVGRGSSNQAKVAILTYNNSHQAEKIGLVGKGVTFDSGGTNVKTLSDIGEMKMDMGGSAAVVGALKLISSLEIKSNLIAVLPLVTNVSSGSSFLPSDIIEYVNGFTVEVGNTDAEGRLILADGLLHVQKEGAKTVLDIATLTGAVGQALGLKMAGIFSNREENLWAYKEIGERTGDYVWPMPLIDDYKTYLKSDCADINNMSSNPFGGAVTASVFLKQFIQEDCSWVHIDMANTVRHWKKDGYYTEGASGFGVRLLSEIVQFHTETSE